MITSANITTNTRLPTPIVKMTISVMIISMIINTVNVIIL